MRPASPCLLVGPFGLFTFKVIIGMCLPVAIKHFRFVFVGLFLLFLFCSLLLWLDDHLECCVWVAFTLSCVYLL